MQDISKAYIAILLATVIFAGPQIQAHSTKQASSESAQTSAIHFGPGPDSENIHFGPGPEFKSQMPQIHFGPGPNEDVKPFSTLSDSEEA